MYDLRKGDLIVTVDRLISNSHCSTYYIKLLYVCRGEGYCELLLILQISYL